MYKILNNKTTKMLTYDRLTENGLTVNHNWILSINSDLYQSEDRT